MGSPQIVPSEFLPHTVEGYLPRHSRSTHAIYLTVLATVIIGLAALPFLFVDVSVKSPGVLKTMSEVSTVKVISSGFVTLVHIKENEKVTQGQLLFEVQSPLLQEKEKYQHNKIEELTLFVGDLNKLVNPAFLESATPARLNTPLYKQAYTDYKQKLFERQTRYKKTKQDFDRNKKLFDQSVIASVDFENFKFEFDKATNDLELLKQTQLSTWQQELRNYEKEFADFQNQLAQTLREKESLNIKAPVAGTIQNLSGIYAGSPVFANQDLAQISPDANLIAEIYVSPNDIGLLRVGMDARLQVNAFNYNQWGLLSGKIKEISGDVQVTNNQPVFEVKCNLGADHLSLKNGYQGKLKKGMTVQARFIVARRSLWQLLYDKVDNWLNPDLK
jgi:HlyD family secretion protein